MTTALASRIDDLHCEWALDRPVVRIVEPDGLASWRQDVAAAATAPDVSPRRIAEMVAMVRSGMPLARVAHTSRVPKSFVLDMVAEVGSRIVLAHKGHRFADRCVSGSFAKRSHLGGPGIHIHQGKTVVVMAPGWQAREGHGRDVRASYAAVVASPSGSELGPIRLWTQALPRDIPVSYAHHAHLFALATGTFRTLAGVTDDVSAKRAYIGAFDEISDKIAGACDALISLCQPDLAPRWVRPHVRLCSWLLPHPDELLRAVDRGDAFALGQRLAMLRHDITRQPARYFPRTLADLTKPVWRAAVSELGHHIAEMCDSQVSVPLDDERIAAAVAAAMREDVAVAS